MGCSAYRSVRRIISVTLFIAGISPLIAENHVDTMSLEGIRPSLEASIEEMRSGVRTHTGSLLGGFVFPPAWVIGTLIGSEKTLETAEDYRNTMMLFENEDPLPELRGARRWQMAGVVGHGVALLGLTSVAVLGVLHMDPDINVDRELGIAGGVMTGGVVAGLIGTTIGTWRARNTVMRFHLSYERQ